MNLGPFLLVIKNVTDCREFDVEVFLGFEVLQSLVFGIRNLCFWHVIHPFLSSKSSTRISCTPRIPKPISPISIGSPLIGPEAGGGLALMFNCSRRKSFSSFDFLVVSIPAAQTAPKTGRPASLFNQSLLEKSANSFLSFAMILEIWVLSLDFFFGKKPLQSKGNGSWE